MDPLIYTSIVLFVAYTVRGITGFGSGLIAIPLLALQHPLTLVVPLVVFIDFLGSAAQGLKNRSAIAWKELYPLLPFTMIGCVIALYLFSSTDLKTLNMALGIFILFFAVYQLLPHAKVSGPTIWAVPAGFFGGLIGTLFGTGGPFYMVYLSIRGLEKIAIRASFATYFFIDGTIRMLGFFQIGFIDEVFGKTLLVWLPAAAIGLFIGGRIHVKISAQIFKYFISAILIFSAYKLLAE